MQRQRHFNFERQGRRPLKEQPVESHESFDGDLAGMCLEICDSLGVNANDYIEHKNIAEDELNTQHYDLLIYIMNATQLFTNDDDFHIDFVKGNCGDTNILFVMNKIDMIEPETEDFATIVERVRRYLLKKFQAADNDLPDVVTGGLVGQAKSSTAAQSH